jgi:penicillin V acylase-like amidase (Ntn superfamily)
MTTVKISYRVIAAILTVLTAVMLAPAANACSRVTWLGPEGAVITGRSMDWPYSFHSHLYAYPRGLEQNGAGGINSLKWTTKYGAIVVAGTTDPEGPIDGIFDGMNEAGLVANLLYLGESDFGPAPTDDRPRLSFAAWVQYVLTTYKTVNEVVDAFTDPAIYVVPINFGPGGAAKPTVHLSVTDASGDSAIIEYLDGKPVIHHGREYQVMTNSPTYDEQLKLDAQWDNVDKNTDLPGSIQSADRFVRASYYLENLPQTTDQRQAVAGVFSVMRNVSVPWGVGDPEHPNLSPTYWRSVADSTTKVYYFESALSPNIVWVNLNNINFAPGSGVRAVAVEENYSIIGNIDKELKPAAPIRFLAPPANPPAGAAPAATGSGTTRSDATGAAEPAKKTFGWWWIPVGLAVVAVIGALIRPLTRRPVEAATLAATRAPITPVPPAPPVSPASTISDRQSSTADDSSIQVTYENNALGDGEQSGTDKSDSVPD